MLITINNFVSFKNLLEEAAYQQNIVLQASQALNVAESSADDKRGSPEVLEGERLLLLASNSLSYPFFFNLMLRCCIQSTVAINSLSQTI